VNRIFALRLKTFVVSAGLFLAAQASRAEFTSLNMGLDYSLRGIAVENNDMNPNTKDRLNYYSHDARFYLRSWLNEDVEASFRLQSINIWGMEGSSDTLVSRYPSTDGSPYLEEAYIHLPNFAWKRVNLVLGRQPITLGDGALVSDDGLGFNAIRGQVNLPWKFDLDGFTAKIAEGLGANDDFDLSGAVLGTNREHNRWELAYVREKNSGQSTYILPTATATATQVTRWFLDLRLFGNLKDAFYKLEYIRQYGDADLQTTPAANMDIRGEAYKLELGAQTDNYKWGRFGVRALYAQGSGDDAGTKGTDEAFRPTFAKRWDGLQRAGYGQHYAATMSDVYDPNAPFSPTATGLPIGFSGVKTMGLGINSTQGVRWTGTLEYFTYNALTKPTGKNDLGAEIDANVLYRYTGFVTFNVGMTYFFPGEVYGSDASRVTRYHGEAHVRF